MMRATNLLKYYLGSHSRYLILGAGTGGISISSQLLRSGIHPQQIRILDPSDFHYYQPGWTIVGAGQKHFLTTSKKIEEVIPQGVTLAKEKVKLVQPKQNKVICENGSEFTYDELIVGTGLRLQFEKVEGLQEALDDPQSKVGSIYRLDYAQKLAKLGQNLKSGRAIFSEPVFPIKCAGAPQKILYLWSDVWSSRKLPVQVQFYKTVGVMFAVPKYSQALTGVAAGYNIKTTFKTPLIKVKGNEATFQNLDTKELIVRQFDFLHVVPPMGPHSYIAESGLADAAGYLDVHKYTLRHNKYSNIWGIGDCTSLPNSKTAAAVFSQNLALLENLLAVRKNPTLTELPGRYEGYASCPLFVGKLKLILAEFKYDGVVDQTFFKDQERPRYLFYLLKRYFFPWAYWNLVPRGLWAGRKGIKWA